MRVPSWRCALDSVSHKYIIVCNLTLHAGTNECWKSSIRHWNWRRFRIHASKQWIHWHFKFISVGSGRCVVLQRIEECLYYDFVIYRNDLSVSIANSLRSAERAPERRRIEFHAWIGHLSDTRTVTRTENAFSIRSTIFRYENWTQFHLCIIIAWPFRTIRFVLPTVTRFEIELIKLESPFENENNKLTLWHYDVTLVLFFVRTSFTSHKTSSSCECRREFNEQALCDEMATPHSNLHEFA